MKKALESDFYDFEKIDVDAIITRNKKDFETSTLPIYTPAEMIDYFQKKLGK